MKKLLLIDSCHTVFSEVLVANGFQITDGTTWLRSKVLSELPQYDAVCLRSRILVDKEFINAATHLKCIARVGSGMESIDVSYAREKGITCLNSPEGNCDAVAEHVVGMILSIHNNLGKADSEIRLGKWNREENRGTELYTKTLGIIGYGHTGSAVAQKIHSFGIKILAYDKYKSGFSSLYVQESTLEDIFREADIVTFHVPLNQETHYMADENFFNRFQNKICIVNASRGQVVKTDALVSAMKSNQVYGACLDVNEYEDFSFENQVSHSLKNLPEAWNYLVQSPKTILTPHIAGWTVESKFKLAKILADKIVSLYSAV